MQYLNAVLWDSYPENAQDEGPEILLTPKISLISENGREICVKSWVLNFIQQSGKLLSLENIFVAMNLR